MDSEEWVRKVGLGCYREHTFPSRIAPLVVCHLAFQSSSLSSHPTLIHLFLLSSGPSVIPALSGSIVHPPGCLVPLCPVLVHVHFKFTGESPIVFIIFMSLFFHNTITADFFLGNKQRHSQTKGGFSRQLLLPPWIEHY
jgi:hypothetical protein